MDCIYCGHKKLTKHFDLGMMPLVNNLLDSKDQAHELYPLRVFVCSRCTMGQIDHIVDPLILYSHYRYKSSMSKQFISHCSDLAFEVSQFKETPRMIISIAENDGVFLEEFNLYNQTYGYKKYKTLAVEPATNLCEILKQKKIPFVNKFFNYQTALDLSTKYAADVIVAQNVFAHLPNPHDFFTGIKTLLKDTGTLIIEVPWFAQTLNKYDFTQIYHEHIGYVTLEGMRYIARKYNMHIVKTRYFDDIHGGTVRFYIKNVNDNNNYTDMFLHIGMQTHEEAIQSCLLNYEISFKEWLAKIENKLKNKKIYGVGASAKGCILLNLLKDKINIDRIYDNTPEKQGKFQPGTLLPILPFDDIAALTDDATFFVLSPNWADEIVKNVKKLQPKAKFIIPNKEVKEV